MKKKLTYKILGTFILCLALLCTIFPTASATSFDPGFETKSATIFLINLDTLPCFYYKDYDLYGCGRAGERS